MAKIANDNCNKIYILIILCINSLDIKCFYNFSKKCINFAHFIRAIFMNNSKTLIKDDY